MSKWLVLIVDDDPVAVSVHQRMVNAQPGFSVVAVASSSEDAVRVFERRAPVDLVLLDVELPGASGTVLLRALRAQRGPEVIGVTANSDPKVVAEFIHRGAVDYLVKPFPLERLREGLLRFVDRRETLGRSGSLAQRHIDRLYAEPERHLLPAGLAPDTLDVVRSTLRLGGQRFTSAEDVATRSELSRVTARRYLEYLVDSRQAEMETFPDGPGRPRKLYRSTLLAS